MINHDKSHWIMKNGSIWFNHVTIMLRSIESIQHDSTRDRFVACLCSSLDLVPLRVELLTNLRHNSRTQMLNSTSTDSTHSHLEMLKPLVRNWPVSATMIYHLCARTWRLINTPSYAGEKNVLRPLKLSRGLMLEPWGPWQLRILTRTFRSTPMYVCTYTYVYLLI